MVEASVRQKPKFLTFIVTLLGLYVLTVWAGLLLLQPLSQSIIPASQSGGLPWVYPGDVNNVVTAWWQYFLFGLYNVAVWVGAYFIAARIIPRLFS